MDEYSIKKLSLSEKDVLVLSFKDVRLYKEFMKNSEHQTKIRNSIKALFKREVGIIPLPPGIELGVIEKKEIAPWVAFTQMTGETGLPEVIV
uniref:Uncharacterized protein n=1 Tax=viral metagenome TaxID=1070528 RepID=A0A6M3KU51_9ZZZZ